MPSTVGPIRLRREAAPHPPWCRSPAPESRFPWLRPAVKLDPATRLGGGMTPEIEAIVAAGASTLVTAVATDAWKLARAGFTRVFGRNEVAQEAATERRL